MENIEWQAVLGFVVFVFSWIGLSHLRRYFDKIERRKARKKILEAIAKLNDE